MARNNAESSSEVRAATFAKHAFTSTFSTSLPDSCDLTINAPPNHFQAELRTFQPAAQHAVTGPVGGTASSSDEAVAASAALVLYRRPPQARSVPEPAPLEGGEDLRLALGSLIDPGDGDPAALRWRAS